MWQYLFLLLRRQPGKTTLAGGGFLLAACALILLSATTQTTVTRASQIINQNWRPTYDLAVLPPSVKLPANQRIPADMLEGYGGGINIAQYEQIKRLPGIEVAAPIAYIGYIQMPTPSVYFSDSGLRSGYYEVDWTLSAFNGERTIIETQETDIVAVDPNCDISSLGSLGGQINSMFCPTSSSQLVPISTPSTGTFLLAAIDPGAENQLVHLDTSISQGRMLSETDTIHLDASIPDNPGYYPSLHRSIPYEQIPMLIHRQLPGQIALNATFTLLYSGTQTPEQIAAKGGVLYLQQLPGQKVIFQGAVPMVQNDPQRFSGASLLWNGHSWQRVVSSSSKGIVPYYSLDFSGASAPAGLSYQPATAPDGSAAYKLVPQGAQGPELAFRTLSPLRTVKNADILNRKGPEVFYEYQAVGEFTGSKLEAQLGNPLNWLPENTYTVPPVVLRYDAQGRLVKSKLLLPTTNTAGYVMQPPLALTTINAARQLVGNNCINAIRVRVVGGISADQEGWKRVQQVAQEIHQQTGLQVVVTLGSSPKPTLVYVPGARLGQYQALQDVPSVGWVEERWIQIAVALTYLKQVGTTRLLLLSAVLAVCLGYLVVTFSTLAASQHRNFAILSALGWRPWQPARIFLAQALLLALAGGAGGMGLALLISLLIEATPLWPVVVWTLPGMLVLALLSSLYPLWKLWHLQPGVILRASPSVAAARGPRLSAFLPPLAALVVSNLTRSRPRTVLATLSLFLSSLLLVLMASGLLAFRESLQGTLLGDFILLQTAVPQLAGCAFALLLSFLSVADLLLLQVRERQQEIGLLQALGWRPGLVQRLFVQEGILLALAGALPGVLVALNILEREQVAQHVIPPLLLALSVGVLMLLVSALATIPALRAISRLQLVQVLRAE